MAVVAGVVGAIIASGVGVAIGSFDKHTTVVQAVTRMMTPTSMSLPSAANASPNWPAVADSIAPSVVSITTTGSSGNQTGSGVLYVAVGDRSYILTSANLIGDDRVKVTFNDRESQYARIVGIDRKTGLALVSVSGTSRIFPTFSPESALQVAEPVLGVGSRTSRASGASVVAGSISSLDDAINVGDASTMEGLVAVNRSTSTEGNAGGALVDPLGTVFGIEAQVSSPDASTNGQSFVVPIDIADHVARQMLGGERVTHPWLGTVDTADLSTATAHQFQLAGGAQVTQVTPGSPAERAGMATSDIITAFNGHPVRSTGGLTGLIVNCQPGYQATISYLHKGKPATATVTMAETPSDVNLG
ncbi:MAG: S1C family serine protease [Actinomycetota bacterium]|nr:S1C family serine protease [Actinomycetota bacterium]